MQEQNRNIDELMREALGDYRERPRDAAWEGVQKRLAEKGDKRKPALFPLRWWWVLLSVLLIVIVGFWLSGKVNNKDIKVAERKEVNENGNEISNSKKDRAINEEGITTKKVPTINEETETVAKAHKKIEAQTAKQTASAPVAESSGTGVDVVSVKGTQEDEALMSPATEKVEVSKAANIENTKAIQQTQSKPQKAKGTGITGNNNGVQTVAAKTTQTPKQNVDDEVVVSVKGTSEKTVEQAKEVLSALPDDTGVNTEAPEQPTTQPRLAATENEPLATVTQTPKTNEAEVSNVVNAIEPDTISDAISEPATANNTNVPVLDSSSYKEAGKKKKEPKEKKDKNVRLGFANKIGAGVKVGYQSSFNTNTNAAKYVFAGFVDYNITNKFAVSLQPAYLTGNAKLSIQSTDKIYYNITSQSLDSNEIRRSANAVRDPDTLYRSYTYTETYDSVRVSTALSDTKLWEVEIPVMLRYNIFNGLFITTGGIGSFTNTISIAETKDEYTGLQNTYEQGLGQVFVPVNQKPPPYPGADDFENIFSHTGEPITNYQPLADNTAVKQFFRMGYVIGLGVEIKKQLLIDVSMLKMSAGSINYQDAEIKKAYTQPYFRIIVGYKFK